MARLIKRGDLWVVNLEPGFGREIHKKRPAVIISTNYFNQSTYHVIVIPCTSIVPQVITEDIVPLGKVKGFKEESVLLPLLVRSIDQERLIKKIGRISKEKLLEIEDSLKLVLGMIDLN